MKAIRHLALTSLIALTSLLHAAVPSGKPQQLTSPDQVPEGLAKSDWQSIRAAYEAGQHEFKPIEGGWQARNPGQQWTTKFDGRGFLATPREGDWAWGLELESYGRGEQQRKVNGQPAVKAEGQRLSYQWDAALQEWWVNDQRGLEHGYILAQRPAAQDPTDPSVLSMIISTRGTLTPKVMPDALGVSFCDASGATVLNYAGLKVWDADGKVLASRFESAGAGRVRLLVEESAARYPITIDPIAQQAYLKASNPGTTYYFGSSVAVSGDTVVVGAPFEASSTTGINSTPDEGASLAGAAYVFVRSGTAWSQQAYLKASNTGAGDRFGDTVAVSGDTVVVGANLEDSSTTGINSTPDEGALQSGAAYVFVRSGTAWSQQAYLKASNTGASDRFGNSVAVSGDTVVVGAYFEASSTTGINSTPNEGASSAGAAYVFVRSGTAWSQQAYLKASNTGADDYFGGSVAVSGDTVVVGAHNEDSSTTGINSTPNELSDRAGAAYVFVRSGTAWSQQAYLKASNTGAFDQFGVSVAVSGDTVVVGAHNEASSTTGINSTPNEGAAYAGAAYVFVRSGTAWGQQAYLKASNPGTNDYFGSSVAVSGDTVVVGAWGEDSSTTGINSTPNKGATSAGAAYVFVRSGTAWSRQAYLKASNTGEADLFGHSVAVSGDTVVVGAHNEDSSTTGVNSTPNEGARGAGATYLFTGLGPAPTISTPTVSTPTTAAVTATTATLGGNVTADGGATITERGVVYAATATNSDPLIGGTGVTKVTTTGTTGVFTVPVSLLTAGTGYSYKAYAINSQGTSYTSVGTFTTSSSMSTNADLSALTLSSGTLSPTFASATISYTASVANAVSSITVTPTRALANATIEARVNAGLYASVTSGSASAALPLNAGANTVEVRVTSPDGTTTKTYTVTVNRLPPLAANASLSNLVLSSGTLSPRFDAATTSYTASVPSVVTSVAITPTVADPTATIRVKGVGVASGRSSSPVTLAVGAPTVIEVTVTAQDGVTVSSYTVEVTRQLPQTLSNNANLNALSLSSGTLSPAFAPGTMGYTAAVSESMDAISVTPTAADSRAKIQVRVNGGSYEEVASGSASSPMLLQTGSNTIGLKVVAADGTSKTYTVSISRLNLQSPSLSCGDTTAAVVKSDGTMWTWGSNFTGNLGWGGSDQSRHPDPMQVGSDSDWLAVSCGGVSLSKETSSAYTIALKRDGSLWGWGSNEYSVGLNWKVFQGPLGDGLVGVQYDTPVRIGSATNWATIDAGRRHICAIQKDGSLWAWGDSGMDTVGRVGMDTDWTLVSAGTGFSAAIKKDGSLWTWGYNSSYQLGDGTTTRQPIPQRIGNASDWVHVDCGDMFALGIKRDGTLWAWGFTDWTEYGFSKTVIYLTSPTKISAGSFVSAAAGRAGSHAAIIAISSDGAIWQGVYSANRTQKWSAVASGSGKLGIGLRSDGTLWSWDSNNFYGQLGNGIADDFGAPLELPAQVKIGVVGPNRSPQPTPVIEDIQPPPFEAGKPYHYQVRLSGGAQTSASYRAGYSATGLPPGLAINPNTGLISGTPSRYSWTNPNYTPPPAQVEVQASYILPNGSIIIGNPLTWTIEPVVSSSVFVEITASAGTMTKMSSSDPRVDEYLLVVPASVQTVRVRPVIDQDFMNQRWENRSYTYIFGVPGYVGGHPSSPIASGEWTPELPLQQGSHTLGLNSFDSWFDEPYWMISNGKRFSPKEVRIQIQRQAGTNTPPEVSDLPNLAISAGGSASVRYLIRDAEIFADKLSSTIQVSDPNLLTIATPGSVRGLHPSSAETRSFFIIAKSNKTGTATVTVRVSDGFATTTRAFVVTVGAGGTPTGGGFNNSAGLLAFGDSLSSCDPLMLSENSAEYFNLRWSNGPNWVDKLAERLGGGMIYGVNSFAVAGSETSDLGAQVSAYEARGDLQVLPTLTVTLWSGGNDFINRLDSMSASAATWDGLTTQFVSNITGAMRRLNALGARKFVVLNLPDLGRIPGAADLSTATRSQVTSRVKTFNAKLKASLAVARNNLARVSIVEVDVFTRFNGLMASPAKFGFTQTRRGALEDPALVDRSFAGPGSSYLFWDSIHPSAKAHQAIAEWATAAVPVTPPRTLTGTMGMTFGANLVEEGILDAGAVVTRVLGLPAGVTLGADGVSLTGTPSKASPGGTYSTLYYENALGQAVSTRIRIDVQGVATALQGSWEALVGRDADPTSGNLTDLGGKIRVQVQLSGACSAQLSLGGQILSAIGVVSANDSESARVTVTFPRRNLPALQAELEMGAVSQRVSGWLKESGPGQESPIMGWRQTWSRGRPATNYAGAHHLGLAPASGVPGAPEGWGYCTARISTLGVASLALVMADGAAVTDSAILSPDGEILASGALYGKTGSVTAVVQLASGVDEMAAGTLSWLKRPQAPAQRSYAAGFGPLELNISGGIYTVSPAGLNVLGLMDVDNNAALTFEGGGIELGALNPDTWIRFNARNQILVPKLNRQMGSNPANLTAAFNASIGLVSGTFTLVDQVSGYAKPIQRVVTYKGLVIPGMSGARGHFQLPLLPNESSTLTTSPIMSGQMLLWPAEQ